MKRDFLDMLSALSAEGAEFLVVGSFALAVHGHPRATGDIDLWVRPSPENAERVVRALGRFGSPLHGATPADFTAPDLVFQIGVAPTRIDILTSLSGLAWIDAWPHRVEHTWGTLRVAVLGRAELIRNKRAVGRPKDIADAEALEG